MKIKVLLISLFCLSFLNVEAQKKGKSAAPAVVSKPDLDINTPEGALKADRKITSSLKDGENCFYTWEGNVYSRVPGEKDRLLFTYQGMNVRTSVTKIDSVKGYGWRHVSREYLIYMDPKTKQIMNTWKNPWSGEDCEVFHIANDPVNGRGFTYADANGTTPYKFRGRVQDGTVMMLSEVPLFYTNPLAGEYQDYVGGTYQAMEIFNTSLPLKELIDGNKDKADDVNISWTRVSKFLPWMKMGDRSGQLIFSGIGKKVASFESLPDALKNEIKTNAPIYQTAPPLDDARPNETSWTYFKKKMEAKKAKK